jgi:carbonic anhydrase
MKVKSLLCVRGGGVLLAAALALLPASCGKAAAPKWSYAGKTGPERWHELDPAYRAAKEGREQSPVDIGTGALAGADGFARPEFQYRAGRFEIENNGHTVELVPEEGGENFAVIDGAPFRLQQIHFHAPSEHLVDGKGAALEAHLVHADEAGNLAVVGVFLESGRENAALREVFARIPPEETGEGAELAVVTLDPAGLLPAASALYRYAGSLTTPPCSEGVIWHIFALPLEASGEQIAAFTAVYSGNSRPAQPLNGRRVYSVR